MKQETVIYFINSSAPLYVESYFADSLVSKFKSCGLEAYVLPAFCKEQAM